MASNIDITKPVAVSPTTQSVRDNFSAAKTEIEALQGHLGTGGTAHAAVTTSVNGFMSSADKTKLDNITGTNTGDETNSTIKTKLGITTLSGSNTGDQTIAGLSGSPTAAQLATALSGQTMDIAGGVTCPTGKVVSIADAPTAGTSATNKAYVDSMVSGLGWKAPIQGANLIGEGTTPPGSPVTRNSYIVLTGATGAWSSLVGHVTQWNGTSWVDLGAVAVGDRYGLSFETATAVTAPFTGKDNQIATVTGGSASGYTYSYYTPSENDAVFNNNSAAVGFGRSHTYVSSAWTEFGGPASIVAGTALVYSGNTLNVGASGTASASTFLRGDSTWATADQVASALSGQTMNIAGSSTSCTGNAATATTASANTGTFYIGTTAIAGNRASAALVLTGITSIDGSSASCTGNAATATTATTANATATANAFQMGSVGVGTAASGTAGEIRATNNITAYYSDDRLKNRLGNIEGALDKVMSLDAFYYEANETAQALGYDVIREVGVSAQQVEKVMAEVVAPAPIDAQYLTVRYEKLVPLLIAAIKELKAEVEALKG